MNILVAAATDFELAIGARALASLKPKLLNAGLGIAATSFALGKYFASSEHIDLAINIGIAGAFNDELVLGDVVLVKEDLFAWFGAENEHSFEPFALQGNFDQKQIWPNLLHVDYGKYENVFSKLYQVKAITVQTVHGNTESIAKTKAYYQPDIESMEGAAFYFACNQMQIPCVQIRAISNKVETRDKSKWNIDLALANLEAVLNDIAIALKKLS